MAEPAAPAASVQFPFDIAHSPLLEGTAHGFFGSAGGAHQFGFGGEGDDAAIAKLRAAAAHELNPGAPLYTPHQVHSADVVTIGDGWPDRPSGRPVADAVVTARSDVVIGIVTADCGPVLFADPQARVIGAAHTGWRGAHGGVLENTLAAMEALGAWRAAIRAVLGPTIAQASYEVDTAFAEKFGEEQAHHFAPAPRREGIERRQFDLPGYILERLRKAEIRDAQALHLDTYALPGRYHSYRHAVHQGAATYGRQLSAIALA
ncbi:polyphenol oxidase family protein [Erythrobacter sp.]|jgi:YfiH family protein|uniref:polyphenol oxidase family protein n=1 Tax=Erythrobacter sp. TaxID=1042 RepID=UPI002EC6670B|nr:polyphenol oxidase family protein [Erythrobacter sp.]